MEEHWVNIHESFGLSKYKVSNLGNFKNIRTNKLLKPRKNGSGYLVITFRDNDGVRCTLRTHIIILTTFIGIAPGSTYSVDHINRIKTDNRVDNLRWATKKEQNENRLVPAKLNLIEQNVAQYNRKTRKFIKIYESCKQACDELNMDEKKLKIAIQHNSSYNGFIWKYKIINHPDEIWTEIKHENIKYSYYVSTHGRVKRVDSSNEKLLKGDITGNYIRVSLTYTINNSSVVKKHFIHRLVASTFLENHDLTKNQVNHKDGNGKNNHVNNLEWMTCQENNQHAVDNSTTRRRPVKLTNIQYRDILIFSSITRAIRFLNWDINCLPTISHILDGKSKTNILNGYKLEIYHKKEICNNKVSEESSDHENSDNDQDE